MQIIFGTKCHTVWKSLGMRLATPTVKSRLLLKSGSRDLQKVSSCGKTIRARARDSRYLQENCFCETQQHHCTHECTVAVATQTRPAQERASHNPSTDGERLTKSHPYPGVYWQLMAAVGLRISFLQGCCTWKAAHAPHVSAPMNR